MKKNNKNLKISNLSRILLTAVFVTGAIAAISQAAPIAITNNVSDCVQTADGISCQEKSIITVPVSYGLLQNLDVVFTIQSGGSEEPSLEDVFRVEITKSVPKLMYPLRYFHTVAYYPREEVRKVPSYQRLSGMHSMCR